MELDSVCQSISTCNLWVNVPTEHLADIWLYVDVLQMLVGMCMEQPQCGI